MTLTFTRSSYEILDLVKDYSFYIKHLCGMGSEQRNYKEKY
jgi:hypothetical protein